MSARLEELLGCAREGAPSFDRERSLAGARAKRETRARRDRVLRRAAVAASGASLVLVMLLRASSSPASSKPQADDAPVTTREVAAHALDDGGFARD